MAQPLPIAILGGSSAFTPALVHGLLERASDLPSLELRLQGRDPARLEGVTDFCRRHVQTLRDDWRVTSTLDLTDAVRDARLIVNQIRVGGWRGRVHDDAFCLPFGVAGDESIGPGGLSAALRAVPVLVDVARTCRELAPESWFVNLSNPLGPLLRAFADEVPGLRALGLCELPEDTLRRALDLIGVPRKGVEAVYWGVNHQGGFTRILRNGEDLLPRIFAAIDELPDGGAFRVTAEHMRDEWMLLVSYLRHYFHAARECRRALARETRRGDDLADLSRSLHAHYRAAATPDLPAMLTDRAMPWIDQAVVPALVALLGGREARLFVSEANRGHVPFLDDDAIVEKHVILSAKGTREVEDRKALLAIAGPGPAFTELLRGIASYEVQAAAAALEPTADAVRKALVAHPLDLDAEAVDGLTPRILAQARDIDRVTDGERERRAMAVVRDEELPREQRLAAAPSFPLKVQIQTTSVCNARCAMCPWPSTSRRLPQGEMSRATFERIVDELADHCVERTSLFLMNEPLVDARLEDLSALVAERLPATTTTIYTNGLRLTGDRARSLADAGMGEVTVSLVGFDRIAHERVMHGIDFDAVMANLEKVGRLHAAGDLGAMQVRVVCLRIDDVPTGAEEFTDRTGLPVFERPVTNRAGSVDLDALGAPTNASPRFRACQRPFVKAYFLYNGDMVLCNSDWERSTILGNVHELSIESMWNGERLATIRDHHVRGAAAPDSPCASCDYPYLP